MTSRRHLSVRYSKASRFERVLLAGGQENVERGANVGHRQQRHAARLGDRREFEGRRGDDAEGAFAADEHLPQVEAGIVLFQVAVQVQDVAGHGHHFQAEHPLPRQAVANHPDAARVGGDVAPDLTRARGREVDGPGEAVLRAVLVHRRGHRPRFAANGSREGVDRAQRPHAVQAHHYFPLGGHRAAREPRAAPRGDDGYAVRVAQLQQGGDFVRRTGEGHGGRGGGEHLGPVSTVRLTLGCILGEVCAQELTGGLYELDGQRRPGGRRRRWCRHGADVSRGNATRQPAALLGCGDETVTSCSLRRGPGPSRIRCA